jgi:2-haloacid dehalogenase
MNLVTNDLPGQGLSSHDRETSPGGHGRPALLIFDVNETLSDMSPVSQRFEDVGAPAQLARTWFAGVLRDGFALTAVHASDSFARIAKETLRISLHGVPLNRGTQDAIRYIMEGFASLRVHPDVPEGIDALKALGIRLVTLSNGASAVAQDLLNRAVLQEHFDALLSVEDAGIWKPAAGAYAYALRRCDVDATDAMLVAVHPWDIDGAARAGLGTAWINRPDGPYPEHFRAPDIRVRSLTELASQLA